jgi:uncharacterized protein
MKSFVMPLKNALTYTERITEYNFNNNVKHTKIIFHGGEPLLWGIDNFKELLKHQDYLHNYYHMNYVNSIQTNGFLLYDKWIELFKKYKFQVGISLDGPLGLNSHFIEGHEQESFQIVLNNIESLKREKISFGILSVITNQHIKKLQDFYSFFINKQIKNVGLCFCYNPEDNQVVDPILLGDFLIELFNLYFENEDYINIREFNNAIEKIIKNRSNACTNSNRQNCGAFLTIDSTGNIFFCDDYDLQKKDILGNLNTNTINEIVESKTYQDIRLTSQNIIKSKCCNCIVQQICGSGCARNDNNNQSNFFCQTYIKLYSYIQNVLNKNLLPIENKNY